jgi:hypothetical protein
MTVQPIGKSALGRDLYLVTINALDTVQQRQDYQVWQEIRRIALTDPVRARDLLREPQISGFTAATRTGNGRSGIIYWNNTGCASSPIVGACPAQDTAIVDPPTWFTAVPATRPWTVACRRPTTSRPPPGRGRAVGLGRRIRGDRAPDEHGRNVADRAVRDEPAVPRGSRAGVARGRHGRLLGRPVTQKHTGERAGTDPPCPVEETSHSRDIWV